MSDDDLITLGNKNYPIVVNLKEFKGNPLIDIRKFYRGKSDKELKPTKKGIALQKNNFKLLLEALVSSSDQINDWFENSNKSTLKSAENTLRNRVNALEENRREAQDFEVEECGWKSPNFFEVESLGGMDKVVFNSKHLFVENLEKLSEKEEKNALDIISKVLISFSKAREIMDDGEEYTANELFQYLESEWGQILANYLSRE